MSKNIMIFNMLASTVDGKSTEIVRAEEVG